MVYIAPFPFLPLLSAFPQSRGIMDETQSHHLKLRRWALCQRLYWRSYGRQGNWLVPGREWGNDPYLLRIIPFRKTKENRQEVELKQHRSECAWKSPESMRVFQFSLRDVKNSVVNRPSEPLEKNPNFNWLWVIRYMVMHGYTMFYYWVYWD